MEYYVRPLVISRQYLRKLLLADYVNLYKQLIPS